ncbi:MAG: FIST signal transduction protein [Planctomycetota bacterium]
MNTPSLVAGPRSLFVIDPQPAAIAHAALQLPATQTAVIFIGERRAPDLQEVVSSLRATRRPFVGAMFPKLIHGNRVEDSGAIVFGLESSAPAYRVPFLGEFDAIRSLPDSIGSTDKAVLVLLDGLSANIGRFIRKLYGHYGTSIQYLGGGAGSLTLEQKPCVFCAEGVFQDTALILPLVDRLGLGVSHGWSRVMGPVIATEVDNTIIKQINWRSAVDVYREVVEPVNQVSLTPDNFFQIAKGFPFGLEKNESEDVVRDPIALRPDGALVCVGEVPENGILHILTGAPETLVRAAGEAARESVRNLGCAPSHAVVIDCISRVLFLEDRFAEELEAVATELSRGGCPAEPFGALTLGEVSSLGDGYLEFLNKTIVVGTFAS